MKSRNHYILYLLSLQRKILAKKSISKIKNILNLEIIIIIQANIEPLHIASVF